jgi:4-amino-4-deoxy-L-arabinose transferase-like glycosyltransferase
MLYFILSFVRLFGLLGLCCLGAYGLGAWVIRFTGIHKQRIPGLWVYILAVGVIAAGFEFFINRHSYQTQLRKLVTWVKRPHQVGWFMIGLVFLICVACAYSLLVNTLVPPTGWDEVAYHLAVPKIYINAHAFINIPYIPHSNWPMETEALSTLSLLLGSERLAQSFSWLALVLICAILFIYCRRNFGSLVGLLAAAIFVSTPMVTSLAGTSMVELPMTLYSLLATIAWLEWAEHKDERFGILSALLAGLTACVKLNAVTTPIVLGIAMLVISRFHHKNPWKQALFQFTKYGFISLAVVLPWYIKALVQTGNPFWPFFYNLLGGRNWDQLGTNLFEGFIREPNMSPTVWNWFTGIWQLTWEPYRFGSVLLGWLDLVLLPFGLMGVFLLRGTDRRKKFLWIGLLGLAAYTTWFLLTHQTRFLMPAVSLFALFLAVGISWLWIIPKPWIMQAGQVVLLSVLVVTSCLANPANRAHLAENWPYLTGRMSRNQYLKAHIPGFDAFLYMNRELPKDAKVWLSVWESRGYYLDREYIWANLVNQRIIKLEQIQDADQLAQVLEAQGVTHILYSTVLLDRLAYIPTANQATSLIRQFVEKHGRLLYQSKPSEIFELIP